MSGRVCPCCGQAVPASLDMETYKARALPRLAAIDSLAQKIDFTSPAWRFTPEGERYEKLMDDQARDEQAAGL